MLANLMPPPIEVAELRIRSSEIVVHPSSPTTTATTMATTTRSTFIAHPRYRSWLAKCGVTSAETALKLQGEIVSGHPDRHVMRVQLRSGTVSRTVFLKREHAVGWRVRLRNWRASFGWVSRAAREAAILQRLEDANIPCPHWLAYGEDANGRAFLLIDELSGHRELRAILTRTTSPLERRAIVVNLAHTIATYHSAKFDTPDLSAKHVFVRSGSFATTLIDWQSSGGEPTADSQLRALATLHASLAPELASVRERLRFLRHYRRANSTFTSEADSLKSLAKRITIQADMLASRSSIRLQRATTTAPNQQLVWLADEAVCAVPDVAVSWPKPAICEPYYRQPNAIVNDGERVRIRLEDGRPAMLIRYRRTNRFTAFWAKMRGRNWRSRAAELAQLLWQLERHGVTVPPLYAFGQRPAIQGVADSFFVYGLPNGSLTLALWLQQTGLDRADRHGLLRELGRVLRQMHDAGCTLGANCDAVRVVLNSQAEQLLIDPVADVRRIREWSDSLRRDDVRTVLRSLSQPFTRTELLRVLHGYALDRTQRSEWMKILRSGLTNSVTNNPSTNHARGR